MLLDPTNLISRLRAEALAKKIQIHFARKASINREIEALLKQWQQLNLTSLKQWLAEESARLHITPNSVYCRLKDGKYPHIRRVHLNQRLVWVVQNPR